MKILVSNDDGIYAEGINKLCLSLMKLGEVVVVAPDSERSATGHAITMHYPLRVREVKLPGNHSKAYAVDGTPADCIKMGVDILMEEKPDLIFAGINNGANLGTDVLYSGTVSAAIEGCILGFPSAAISLTAYKDGDFTYAAETALSIAEIMLEHKLPPGTLLNINVPDIPESSIKGIRTTRLGVRKYMDNYIERKDPRGRTYYWLGGNPVDQDGQEGTDIDAVANNYVSVTPIHFDLTSYDYMDKVKQWFKEVKHEG